MRRLVSLALTAAALLCASACVEPAPDGPPEIRLGVDACDGCGMSIGETRYAAAVLAGEGSGGRILKFDDIGCLARWEAGSKDADVRRRWVHDRSSERWIDASSATFVRVPELSTPMGSGIAAFQNRSDAEALSVERGGTLLSWSTVLAREQTR